MTNPKSENNQIQEISRGQKSNNEKIFNIRERTYRLALRIIDISRILPKTTVNNIIVSQLIKSGTSIGANVEEGDGSISRKDFLNKAVITRKEAKETKYWLRIIAEENDMNDALQKDINELQEIINILSVMIQKVRNVSDK